MKSSSSSSLESIRQIAANFQSKPAKSAMEGFNRYLKSMSPERNTEKKPESSPPEVSEEFEDKSVELSDTSGCYHQGFEYGAGLGALISAIRRRTRRSKRHRFAKWKYVSVAAQHDAEVTVIELRYLEKMINAMRAGCRLRSRMVTKAFYKWKFQINSSILPLTDVLGNLLRKEYSHVLEKLRTTRIVARRPLMKHVYQCLYRQVRSGFLRWRDSDHSVKVNAEMESMRAVMRFKATQLTSLESLCTVSTVTQLRSLSKAMARWRVIAEWRSNGNQVSEQPSGLFEASLKSAKLTRKIRTHEDALIHGRTKLWCAATTLTLAEAFSHFDLG